MQISAQYRSVLVTGGTGSFGKAFVINCLADAGVERICVLSRGEHAQANMRQQVTPDDDRKIRWFIGDIRDIDRLRRSFEGVDLVVHAAALKRIEVGAYNPQEMVRTNVEGAANVIEAALDAGVQRVVALSTDKAWQPVSPYGYSKALAESLFLAANATTGARGPLFSVTRYGNVAGSAGSVIPKWLAARKAGIDTVQVTDPDCTRFYMTMQQAVDLVVQAACEPVAAAPVIPVGLPAYRVGDLAAALGLKMRITGLPSYEKLHEGMHDLLLSNEARRMSIAELRDCCASLHES